MLNEQRITAIAEEIKANCLSEIPNGWKHTHSKFVIAPLPRSEHKTTYGMASTEGLITISDIYLGTSCEESLKVTLVHEFSHLIVGINENHNARFKRMNDYLMIACGIDSVLAEDNRKLLVEIAKVNKPLTLELWAKLECGNTVLVGKYFKRSKKYTQYNPGTRKLRIEGKPICSFTYVDIAPALMNQ